MALPPRTVAVAAAVAGALAPPSALVPETPDDVDFGPRLRAWAARLPWPERLGVRAFFAAVDLAPLLLLAAPRTFLRLAPDARARFLARCAASRALPLRVLAKVCLLLTMPPFYADRTVRARLGDTTQDKVAPEGRARTFPVVRGADLRPDELDADVVIVGSGAGGAALAKELAERGRSVLVLESGPYRPAHRYPAIAFDALAELYRDAGVTATVGVPPIVVPVGRLVGGTTVVNSGTCFRIPAFVHRRWAERFHLPDDLSLAALAPRYARVEEFLSVRPVPRELLGPNNDVARLGAERLGWSHGALRRNERGCVGSNRCAFGCPVDGKQAMHVSYLPAAVAAGARVVEGATARRVLFAGESATGVEIDVDGPNGRRRLRARGAVTVVAAGTLHTPLLLRGSGVRHRNLGRRLTLHPAVKVSALFPGRDFYATPSVPQSTYVDAFHEAGVMMEGAHVPPDLASVALPGKGSEHKALMERSREIATFGFLVSDEPAGRVHRGIDGRPFLRYDLTRADHRKILFGLERLCELFVAAGAEELYLPTWKLPRLPAGADVGAALAAARVGPGDLEVAAFHPLGTCGLGVNPEEFPLDPDLAVRGRDDLFVCDGSIFPSSLAVNPQLSIMAMALRLAEHLDERAL